MNVYIKEALDFFHTATDLQQGLAFVLTVIVLGMAFTLLILLFYCLPKRLMDILLHRIDHK
jgi:multisubunit Na+/H+ antiporter MnhC subunit